MKTNRNFNNIYCQEHVFLKTLNQQLYRLRNTKIFAAFAIFMFLSINSQAQSRTKSSNPSTTTSVDVQTNLTVPNPLTFTLSDFNQGCQVTDVNVRIRWAKTDGSCTSPGTGNSYHAETGFTVMSPDGTQVSLFNPNTYTGAATMSLITQTFDQSSGIAPGGAIPTAGTYIAEGNLNNFNGLNGIGTWSLLATDNGGGDPICIDWWEITVVTATDNTGSTPICQSITKTLNATGTVNITAAEINNNSSDLCGISNYSVSPSTFDCSNIGNNVVTLTVTDTYGNTNSCTGVVTIQDNINPTISCPTDVIVSADPGSCFASNVSLGIPTASDNCTVIVTNNAPVSYPLGNTIVTWTATDADGNLTVCTQTVTVDSMSSSINGNEDYTGCEGDGYNVVVNGTTYDEGNPSGTEILTNTNGCDSTVTINLVFNANSTGTENYVGCQGDGYNVVVNGTTYDESNPTGVEVIAGGNANGCDSTVTITLVFNAPSTGTLDYIGCEGDGQEEIINGVAYNEANPFGVEIIPNANYLGCDSTITISMVFHPSSTGTENYVGCQGDGYNVVVNGTTYDESNPTGVEVIAGGNANGCDSTVTITLVFNALPNPVIDVSETSGCADNDGIIVNGDIAYLDVVTPPSYSSYSWSNGSSNSSTSISTDGLYTVTVYGFNGCSNSAEINILSETAEPCNAAFTYSSQGNPTGGYDITATPDDGFPAGSYFEIDGIPQAAGSNSFVVGNGTYELCYFTYSDCDSLACSSCDTISISCKYSLGTLEQDCDELADSLICLPLLINNNNTPGIIGMDYCVTYDSNLMTPTGNVTLGAVVLDGDINADYAINTNLNGMVCISIYYTSAAPVGSDFTGNGEIACIEFQHTNAFSAGMNTTFEVDNLIESYDLIIIHECAEDGSLLYEEDNIIECNVMYWDDNTLPLQYDVLNPNNHLITEITGTNTNCSPNGISSTTNPDLFGNFQFNILDGDRIKLDRDIANSTAVMSTINGMDCYWMNLVTTLNTSFTPSHYQIIAMDVNMNGSVTSGDITHVQDRIVLNIGEFPQVWNNGSTDPSKDWLFLDDATIDNSPDYIPSANYPFSDNSGFDRLNVPQPAFCYEIPLDTNSNCLYVDSLSYHAIMLGDNDKSWDTNISNLRMGSNSQLILNMDNAIVSEDECSLLFPITVESGENVRALDFTIAYNMDKLSFGGLELGNIDNGVIEMIYNQVETGDILLTSYAKELGGIQAENAIFYYAKFSILDEDEIIYSSDISFAHSYIDGASTSNSVIGTEISCRNTPIENLDDSNQYSIYPNPFDNGFIIKTDSYAQGKELSFFIYDVAGKLIDARKFVETHEYQNENLAKGVYLYELKMGDELIGKGKLIAQ